jgi:5'-phosphate synthase pdxT subunit
MGVRPIGILALQGDVREHRAALEALGHEVVNVKSPLELERVGAIVLPGGESTAISLLLLSSGLYHPLRDRIAAGMPTFGTCAGLVLLARSIRDGRPDQVQLDGIDAVVRRNGFGRQRFSFETTATGVGLFDGIEIPAVFIRAPLIEAVGEGVEVLATITRDGAATPVLIRQASVLAGSFHPELTSDLRCHEVFSSMVEEISEHVTL